MTSFFSWNMRDFNMSRKHRALRSWIQSEKPIFGCLMETRVREGNHQKCMDAAMPTWKSITNYGYHQLGRIWFCWSERAEVTLLHRSAQMITCAVQIPDFGEQFICSAIYAHNSAAERTHLWREMRETQAAYAHLNLPWILIGDYNVMLSSTEHSRSMDYRSDQVSMGAFQEVVTDCSLLDLAYGGAYFTWWNKRDEDPIGKKLDRALVNGDWLRVFPNSHAYFDAGGVSDHARCLIKLAGAQDETRKPFRFFNFLAENEEFLPSIQESWSTSTRLYHSRTALSDFHRKLKQLKPVLRALNRTHYGDLPNRTRQAFEELCECQNRVLADPNSENFTQAAEASDKWNRLARIEEKFYRQKSCIRWLQAGDQNTTFFH